MKNSIENLGCGMIAFIFSIIIGMIVAISFWTDRTLDFWFTYFKGEPIDVPYWLSLVTTVLLNGIILAVNILSELARLFVS